jgi:hypothetical protein
VDAQQAAIGGFDHRAIRRGRAQYGWRSDQSHAADLKKAAPVERMESRHHKIPARIVGGYADYASSTLAAEWRCFL